MYDIVIKTPTQTMTRNPRVHVERYDPSKSEIVSFLRQGEALQAQYKEYSDTARPAVIPCLGLCSAHCYRHWSNHRAL